MAFTLNNGVSVTINSVDLSTCVKSVTVNRTYDSLEVTSMGDLGHKFLAGLSNDSFVISFNQDYTSGKVNQTIEALLGQTTTCVVKPTSAAVSAANPSYTGTIFIDSWTPVNGAVGDLATVDATFKVNGKIEKATS
jgi:hypothetical protein